MDVTVSDLQRKKGREGYFVRLYFAKTGKRTWRKMGETRQQALRNRNKLLVQLAAGEGQPESVKVSRAITSFKRLRDRRLAEKTRKLHESHYKRWRKRWARRMVGQITTRDIERHFAKCEDLGWSGSTLNRERTLLKAFFKYCRDRGWLDGNADPTRTIKRYRDRPTKPKIILSPEQVDALLRACREPEEVVVTGRRNAGSRIGGKSTGQRIWQQAYAPPEWLYPVVLTALGTLQRLGTILDLRWRHIDVQSRLIRLAANENKGGAEVDIPIGDDLMEVLGSPRSLNERVFPTAPRESRSVSRPFYRAVKRAGIPRCTFHDLRKTGATQLLDAGVPIHVVQAMGGWKRPDVLLKHYTQASVKAKRKAAQVLAELAKV